MTTKRKLIKIIFLTFVFLCVSNSIMLYGQDPQNNSKTLLDSKMELLEYNQKILEARFGLLETRLHDKSFKNKRAGNKEDFFNTIPDSNIPDSLLKPITQAITFNISRIFEGTMQLGYEKAISNNLSLDFSIMGTYVTKNGFGRGYLQNQELAYSDASTNEYIYFNGNMIRSIGGTFRLKNYLLARVNSDSKAPLGLYAAPQLMYRRVWITGNQYVYDNYFGAQKEITRNLDIIQGGVILGSKFAIAKVLCLDVYIGGVMRLSKYYNEPTFTKYKRWNNIDYSGILPTAGINIGILK